ncbi:MAG: hypothetical protein ACI9FU_000157 [Granulosicoccus sp.]|jgi:hypothetical protein
MDFPKCKKFVGFYIDKYLNNVSQMISNYKTSPMDIHKSRFPLVPQTAK